MLDLSLLLSAVAAGLSLLTLLPVAAFAEVALCCSVATGAVAAVLFFWSLLRE